MNKNPAYKKAVLALIIANIIWGAASPIFKWSLQNIPPFSLAFLRFYYATLLLAIILIIYRLTNKNCESLRLQVNKVVKYDGKNLLFLALFGITFNISFFFLGLRISRAINAPIIASAGPVFSFFLAIFFLGERLKIRKLLGMLVSLSGVILIIVEPIIKGGGLSSSIGDIFFVLATLFACGQSIFGKKVYSNHNFLLVTFLSFFIGTLTFFPLALFENLKNPLWVSFLDQRGIFGIIYGAIFSSTIAYSLLGYGLSKIPASETVIFGYIDPINATLVSTTFLGEKITSSFLLGALFVLSGIYLAEKRIQYHPITKLKIPNSNNQISNDI